MVEKSADKDNDNYSWVRRWSRVIAVALALALGLGIIGVVRGSALDDPFLAIGGVLLVVVSIWLVSKYFKAR